MTTTTHCQICGRAVRTVRGLIALHGHSRPHGGVQTQSCPGGHFRPYELANDALPPAIARLERFIQATEAKLAAWAAQPPAEIVLPAGAGAARHPQRAKLTRPAGFDPAAGAGPAAPWDSYERAYARIQEERRAALEAARGDVATLVHRLAGWVPPLEIAGRLVARAAELRRSRGQQPAWRGEARGVNAPGTVTLSLTPAQAWALEHILGAARRKAERELEQLGRPRPDPALDRLRDAWAAWGARAAELLDLLAAATGGSPPWPLDDGIVAEPGRGAADPRET